MKVFLAAFLVLGFGVLVMCFNIIFRKNGEFPQYEVGENEKMKELGIKCMKQQEDEIFGPKAGKKKDRTVCDGNFTEECRSCGLYEFDKAKFGKK